MNHRLDKAKARPLSVRLASFMVVAAAGFWLVACSGASPPSLPLAPRSTPTPYASTPAQASAPAPGNPRPQQGAATPGSQPKSADAGIGEVPKAGASPAAATSSSVKPKTLTVSDKGQGGITVKAIWVAPESPEATSAQLDRYLAFKLTLDTHSGDLGQYNLMKLSVLRDDQGKEVAPAAWQSVSDDSHHREGVLKFPKGAEQGSKYLELGIRDMGGVKERVLRWALAQ